jgi:hypothetical protein
MIRVLSLAAALAVLPLSAALAQDAARNQDAGEPATASEAAVEAAAEAFEARMEAFGARAEAIDEDGSLTKAQREQRIAALWAEYQPEVAVFTATISQHAAVIAQQALANIDMDALVRESLNSPEVRGAMAQGVARGVAAGTGVVANSAWTQNDPESLVTYELMAQYALDQSMTDEDEPEAPSPDSED